MDARRPSRRRRGAGAPDRGQRGSARGVEELPARPPLSRRRKLIFALCVVVAFLLVLDGVCYVLDALVLGDPLEHVPRRELPPKDSNEFRILLFGGSTMHGLPVPPLGLVEQFAYWLRQYVPGREIKAFNFGLPGAHSTYVVRKLAETIDSDPDLIVVLTGHNEYLNPRKLHDWRSPRTMLDSLAIGRVIGRFTQAPALPPAEPGIVRADALPELDRKSAEFVGRKRTYYANLEAVVRLTRRRGVPLLLCTVPCNVRDWPPSKYRSLDEPDTDQWTLLAQRGFELLRAGDLAAVREMAQQMLSADSEDAMAHYLLGRAHLAAGEPEQAAAHLTQAKDLDPVPWRVLSEFNEAIRALHRPPQTIVVDLDLAFRRASPDGLVGFDLIADNCHPTPRGGALIARELVNAVFEHGLFPGARRPSELICPLEQFQRAFWNESQVQQLEAEFALRTGRYCLQPPWSNYEAARGYFTQAAQRRPSDWVIWANLATTSLLEGRVADGVQQLRQARQLRDAPLDFDDPQQTPLLRPALTKAGVDPNLFK